MAYRGDFGSLRLGMMAAWEKMEPVAAGVGGVVDVIRVTILMVLAAAAAAPVVAGRPLRQPGVVAAVRVLVFLP